MIVRVTFKSSNALYNSCLIRLNGWKEAGQVYVSSKPIFNFSFLGILLDLHCLPIVSCYSNVSKLELSFNFLIFASDYVIRYL